MQVRTPPSALGICLPLELDLFLLRVGYFPFEASLFGLLGAKVLKCYFGLLVRNVHLSFNRLFSTHMLSEYRARLLEGKIEAKSVDADEGSCDQNVQLIASNPK